MAGGSNRACCLYRRWGVLHSCTVLRCNFVSVVREYKNVHHQIMFHSLNRQSLMAESSCVP